MRLRQTGFTLIELTVVLTLVGVVATCAVPRFTRLDAAARTSAVNALAGSLRGTAELAYAEYAEAGTAPREIIMRGQTVSLAHGYPDVAGMALALADTSGLTALPAMGSLTFTVNGASTPQQCAVTYKISPGAGSPPAVSTPVTLGC